MAKDKYSIVVNNENLISALKVTKKVMEERKGWFWLYPDEFCFVEDNGRKFVRVYSERHEKIMDINEGDWIVQTPEGYFDTYTVKEFDENFSVLGEQIVRL